MVRADDATIRRRIAEAVKLHQGDSLAAAEAIYLEILAMLPRHSDALYLLGTLRFQQNRHYEALELLQQALKEDPKNIAAHNNLGKVFDGLGRWEESVASFHRALAIDSQDSAALCNLGIAETWLGQSDASEQHLRQSLALDPASHAAWSALGYALYHQGRVREAEAAWRKTIALSPAFTEAHINLGTALLAQQNFVEGWSEFAWRDRLPDSRIGRVAFPQPRWKGEDLRGASLLVIGDQGLGDQILCASLMPFMIERGVKLVVECEPRLASLFARSFRGARVIAAGKPPSPETQSREISAKADFVDLAETLIRHPKAFMRHAGYLKADPVRTAALRDLWRRKAGGRKLIGITWSSARVRLGPSKSSKLATDWAPILKVPGALFVSLQYGRSDGDLAEAAQAGFAVERDDSIDVTRDIDGLAALISAMDMVVSVSNSTVHLAGALNVPVWTLVPAGPGRLWYWFEGRTDSPWYPSMRLFRQAKYGTWKPLMAEVAANLGAAISAPNRP
ncbi:MAG: tetratricopeptide repeat protein [Alphaproteobacteria bacterium]|nr:tetratricopeptide repeat protein [Alphaproteobacteria bacterium]